MKVIIPMAGLGSRFQKASDSNPEYKKPKPFIDVKGRPMVRWATASLPFIQHPDEERRDNHKVSPEDLIFIILKAHDDEYHLKAGLEEIYSDQIHVIIVPELTRGAAETAYTSLPFVDLDEEIIITDSDHFFDGRFFEEIILNRHEDTAGIIPVFRARNEGIPKWSYSLMQDDSTFVTKVAEKDRELMELGAHANIGAYYFSKARFFYDEAEEVIRNDRRFGEADKAEFYIAPLYQNLIEKGYRVEAAIIPEVWGLGTPDDLEYFLQNYLDN